jgi:L,D-transpeptidase YcbB
MICTWNGTLATVLALGLTGQAVCAQTPPPEPPREPSQLWLSPLPEPSSAENTIPAQPAGVAANDGVRLDRSGDHETAAEVVQPAKLDPQAGATAAQPVTPAGPAAAAVRALIERLAIGSTDEEKAERGALLSFYAKRGGEPLWFTTDGVTEKA